VGTLAEKKVGLTRDLAQEDRWALSLITDLLKVKFFQVVYAMPMRRERR
jgi:hypothetical protein